MDLLEELEPVGGQRGVENGVSAPHVHISFDHNYWHGDEHHAELERIGPKHGFDSALQRNSTRAGQVDSSTVETREHVKSSVDSISFLALISLMNWMIFFPFFLVLFFFSFFFLFERFKLEKGEAEGGVQNLRQNGLNF